MTGKHTKCNKNVCESLTVTEKSQFPEISEIRIFKTIERESIPNLQDSISKLS